MRNTSADPFAALCDRPIGDRYRCIERLHTAPERVVILAEDTWHVGTLRVLKLGVGCRQKDPQSRRLLNEFRVLSELGHPAIPRVHDFGFDTKAGWTWMVLERMPGVSPREDEILEPCAVEDIARGILRALDALHARGRFHLDIKPSNLLWDAEHAQVTLIDFDLSAGADRAGARGTLPYAAPEVVRGGERVGPRADLYSLGVTLAVLLTGQVPTLDALPPEGIDVGDGAGAGLRGLIQRLTRINAFERLPSAREAYALVREGSRGRGFETEQGVRARLEHSAFVGRREDLEALVALARAPRRRGDSAAISWVQAASGDGVSRLLRQARSRWLEANVRAAIISPMPGRRMTVAPVLDLAARLSPGRGAPGVPGTPGSVDSEALAPARRQELIRWLLLAARRQRLVLAFEDVHRFDVASRLFLLDLLRIVTEDARVGAGHPQLAIVLTSDPALQPGDVLDEWLARDIGLEDVERLDVDPMDPELAEEHLVQLVSPEEMPGPIRSAILERAGGSPLVIRELVREGRGHAGTEGTVLGGLATRVGAAAGVPPTVRAMVAARCSRLTPAERRTLLLVANCPDGLSSAEIREVLGDEGVDAAQQLEAKRLFVPTRRRWQLPNEIFREALLLEDDAALDPEQCDRIADALAKLGSPRYEEIWHRLAGHAGHAVLDDALDSVRRLRSERRRRELRLLLTRLAHRDALSPFVARVARLQLAQLNLLIGRTHEAGELLQWTQPGDQAATRLRAQVDRVAGEQPAALRRLEGLERFRELQLPLERAEIALDMVDLRLLRGETPEAKELLGTAAREMGFDLAVRMVDGGPVAKSDLRFAWPGDDARARARWLRSWARIERAGAKHEASEHCVRAALRLFSRLGDPIETATAMNDLGVLRLLEGRLSGAVEYLQRALRLRQDSGDLRGIAETESNLGVALRRSDRTEDSIRCFERSRGIRERIGDRAGEIAALVNLANVYLQRRDIRIARAHYESALDSMLVDGRGGERRAVILHNLGVVADLEGRFEEALAHLGEAERIYGEAGHLLSIQACRLQRAEVELQLGRVARASDLLAPLVEGLSEDALGELALQRDLLRVRIAISRGADRERVNALLLQARGRLESGQSEDADFRLVEAQAAHHLGQPERAMALLERRDSGSGHLALGAADLLRLGEASTLEDSTLETELHSVILSARVAVESGEEVPTGDLLAALEEAERLARKAGMPLLIFMAVRERARVRRSQGRAGEVLAAFETALEVLETILEPFQDETLIRSFFATPLLAEFEDEVQDFVSSLPDEGRTRLSADARAWSDEIRHSLFSGLRRIGGHGAEALRRDRVVRPVLELARTLNSTDSERQILQGLVETVVDFHHAERAFLLTIDARGHYRVAVSCTRDRVPIADPDREISRNIVNKVLQTKRSLRSDDAAEDEELRTFSVLHLQVRSVMCAPLVHGEETLGLIYVDNRSRSEVFRDGDVELLDVFATAASSTLVNARLARSFARDEKMRVLGRIAEDVAHEFNNLLTPILGRSQGLLERIEEGELEPAGARRALEVIEQAALDASAVVRRFQDYARVRRDSARETLEVAPLLRDVSEFTETHVQKTAHRTGKRIEVEIQVSGQPTVVGEAVALREVFTNLLLNAVDATAGSARDFGEIRVSVSERGERAMIVFADNGTGMSESVREQLFDPYFSTKEDEGSGLGMSVILSHLQRHRGTIDVQSEEGQGTEITIALPAAGKDAAPPAAAETPRGTVVDKPGPNEARRRMLVVDDDHGVRALMCDVLRREGYSVAEASDGRRAIDLMAEAPFEVVISDIGMSPLDGWEVAREIKKIDQHCIVVMVSGWSAAIDAETLQAKNADFILGKPFPVRDLAEVAREAFHRRDLRGAPPSIVT